jgi:hypothetical protein
MADLVAATDVTSSYFFCSCCLSCCGNPRFIFVSDKDTIPPIVISVCNVIYVSNIFYYVPPAFVLVSKMALFQRYFRTNSLDTPICEAPRYLYVSHLYSSHLDTSVTDSKI